MNGFSLRGNDNIRGEHKVKKKQRIPGYFKSNNKFRDKNNNLNSFLKSLKESFEFTKENWFMISSLSIGCLCITLIRAYSVTFSGNVGAAAEYVQYYITGNLYKLVTFISFPFGFIVSIVIIPVCVSVILMRDNKYGKVREASRDTLQSKMNMNKVFPIRRIFFVVLIIFLISLVINLFLLYFLVVEIKYVSWIFIMSLVISFFSLCMPFIMMAVFIFADEKINLKVYVLIATFFMFLIINLTGDFVGVINWDGSGYASCIKDRSNPNDKGVTALPISYDARGVQVFTGEYDSNSKKWKNEGENVIHREYLQFEKGYKVTSGACKSGSGMSSVPPPQGQQLP